jgi:hypothetical protein
LECISFESPFCVWNAGVVDQGSEGLKAYTNQNFWLLLEKFGMISVENWERNSKSVVLPLISSVSGEFQEESSDIWEGYEPPLSNQ